MRRVAIVVSCLALISPLVSLGATLRRADSCVGTTLDLQEPKEEKMTLTSKTFSASAATLFTLALFAISAPAAQADDFCITNGAQMAHGCGYPTMAACQAASAGIGGMCVPAAGNKNPNDALAKQQTRTRVKKVNSDQ